MKKARYNINIKNFLPHREPMLMATVTPYLDEDSVVTHFEITEDCIFLNSSGKLSETGLIENAAQASTAIVGQSYFDDEDLEGASNKIVGYISAIKKAEIRKLPGVNELLVTKAQLISRYDTGTMSMCTVEAATFRNDDLIVDCTFNFLIHEVE
ncbi:ABC transporter permease [Maribacter halichondriae]|uniref:ABC transporter permease n=1 Tax=Maribacter halichondriae TaxID=2980554 RepID=UPI00235952E1|nr:ABC transporter permease [Maribacter sp. Hal144]